jgi:hypothetical protein
MRFRGAITDMFLQLCTVLTYSCSAMGEVVGSNRLFFVSMIMWPIFIYILHVFCYFTVYFISTSGTPSQTLVC